MTAKAPDGAAVLHGPGIDRLSGRSQRWGAYRGIITAKIIGGIHALTAAMAEAQQIASDIAEGGDAYPAGVRDLARRFAEECDARLQAVATITGRITAA